MSQDIAARVEIEALRGEFIDAGDDARLRPLRLAVHTGRCGGSLSSTSSSPAGDPRWDRAARRRRHRRAVAREPGANRDGDRLALPSLCHDTESRGQLRCRHGHQNCISTRKEAGR